MGLPAKRRTKQSKRERASHFALVAPTLTTCTNCKRRIPPHRVCPHCGYYRGRAIAGVADRLSRRADKHARRRGQKHDHGHDHDKGKKDDGKKHDKKDGKEKKD